MTPEEQDLVARLEGFLSEKLGQQVSVSGLQLMTGGNAREVWAFEARAGDETHELVLRKNPPGGGPQAIRFQLDRGMEFRIMRLAHEGGVPCAKVLWLVEDPAVFGEAGFIMERLHGESIPRRILRDPEYSDARTVAAFQLGQILAKTHQLDPSSLGLTPVPKGVHPARLQMEEYRGYMDELDDPRPVWEAGMRWLEDNLPDQWRVTLVHGDFRNGNLMVDQKGIRGVLDWEIVHLGDPMEDLGWLCVKSWRYGNNDKPAGGFGSRQELLDGYESVAGFRPDEHALRFWEVFGTLKWGVLSSSNRVKREKRGGIAGGVMATPGRTLEGLAQSRRACEMERDLLDLLMER